MGLNIFLVAEAFRPNCCFLILFPVQEKTSFFKNVTTDFSLKNNPQSLNDDQLEQRFKNGGSSGWKNYPTPDLAFSIIILLLLLLYH